MARHTLRGTIDSSEVRRLIIDDGIFTQGHKVMKFEIFPVDMTSGGADVSGVLSIDYDGARQEWLAEDGRQIGWSSTTMSTSNSVNNKTDILDPDHIVIRDLYVTGYSNSGRINYLVIVEPVSLSEDEVVLQLIKERSQDDSR
jgi:hypothetical protein